ncbi:MAG: hypothetical protein AABP62_09375 [Planctomycetota bacterium]
MPHAAIGRGAWVSLATDQAWYARAASRRCEQVTRLSSSFACQYNAGNE